MREYRLNVTVNVQRMYEGVAVFANNEQEAINQAYDLYQIEETDYLDAHDIGIQSIVQITTSDGTTPQRNVIY